MKVDAKTAEVVSISAEALSGCPFTRAAIGECNKLKFS
jgi:hypothetical protein